MKPRHQSQTSQRGSSQRGQQTSSGGGALRETFLTELKDLYDAEKQLIKALPKMAKAAENEELQAAFQAHLTETQGQVERLEQVFEVFGEKASGKKCKGMQGLIEEAEELIEEGEGDAALICGAQKVEHYEIAAYGSLVAWARLMDKTEASDILEESLDEEKQADRKLTDLAQTCANVAELEAQEEA